MTEPEAQLFAISHLPIIDPFALIDAVHLINTIDAFQSIMFDTLKPFYNHKEIEHEKLANGIAP